MKMIFKKNLIIISCLSFVSSLPGNPAVYTASADEKKNKEEFIDRLLDEVEEVAEEEEAALDEATSNDSEEGSSIHHHTLKGMGLLLLAGAGYAVWNGTFGTVFPDNVDDSQFSHTLPFQDVNSNFMIYGRNDTHTINQLTTINGIPVEELENIMRPNATGYGDRSSVLGFLGPKESLLTVMADDNNVVLNELGTTHQELIRPLLTLLDQCRIERTKFKRYCRYKGQLFSIHAKVSGGVQATPFVDGAGRDTTAGGDDITVVNLGNRAKIEFADVLLPMIQRYGFYEGLGSPYRLNPKQIKRIFPRG